MTLEQAVAKIDLALSKLGLQQHDAA